MNALDHIEDPILTCDREPNARTIRGSFEVYRRHDLKLVTGFTRNEILIAVVRGWSRDRSNRFCGRCELSDGNSYSVSLESADRLEKEDHYGRCFLLFLFSV